MASRKAEGTDVRPESPIRERARQPGTAAQIARQFVGDKPDVIVAIATPTAQAVVSATKSIPVVYSAVTDPVAAQLVTAGASGANVTGVSDMSPIDNQIALIREITPNVKPIGVVYNPGEANSVVVVNQLKKMLPAAGLTLVGRRRRRAPWTSAPPPRAWSARST